MNGVVGSVYMEINGGSFASPIYAVCRSGSKSGDVTTVISGSVTLKINGGTFNKQQIYVVQPTSDKTPFSSTASVTVCITNGTFPQSRATVEGTSAVKCNLYVTSSFSGNVTSSGIVKTIDNAQCAAIKAPEIKIITLSYSTPPLSDKKPTTGALTAAEESKLTAKAKENLQSINSMISKNGADKYAGYRVLFDNSDSYNFKAVENVRFISMLTGEYSINKTITNYNIAGAGGGYMIDCGEYVLLAFGDNNAEGGLGKPWRANSLGYTTDTDYTDGITFDGFYTSDMGENGGYAEEFLASAYAEGHEASKIPTGGIMIGDTLYFCYMSVRGWDLDDGPIWPCNYGGLAISRDMGRTWELPSDLRWPEESNFGQLYPVIDGDYVYFFGVPGGRRGALKLMRVPINEIENFYAYEYMVGRNADGSAKYERGYDAMMTDYAIIEAGVGGVGVMFNEYLGEWMITYCTPYAGDIQFGSIVMRVAKTLDGIWSEPALIMSQASFGSVYEPRISPKYVTDGGRKFMLICSRSNVYNSLVFEIEISKK